MLSGECPQSLLLTDLLAQAQCPGLLAKSRRAHSIKDQSAQALALDESPDRGLERFVIN